MFMRLSKFSYLLFCSVIVIASIAAEAEAGKGAPRTLARASRKANTGHYSTVANNRLYQATVVTAADGRLLKTMKSSEVLGDGWMTLVTMNHHSGTVTIWNGPKGKLDGPMPKAPRWLPELAKEGRSSPPAVQPKEQSGAPIWLRLAKTSSKTTDTPFGRVKRYYRGEKLVAARLTRTQQGYAQSTWYDVARGFATVKTRGFKGEVSDNWRLSIGDVQHEVRKLETVTTPQERLVDETPASAAERLAKEDANWDAHRLAQMRANWTHVP